MKNVISGVTRGGNDGIVCEMSPIESEIWTAVVNTSMTALSQWC